MGWRAAHTPPGRMRGTEPPERMGNQNWDAGNPRRAQLPQLMTLGERNAILLDAGAMSQGAHIRASRRTPTPALANVAQVVGCRPMYERLLV